jgi:hypothetical protein
MVVGKVLDNNVQKEVFVHYRIFSLRVFIWDRKYPIAGKKSTCLVIRMVFLGLTTALHHNVLQQGLFQMISDDV